MKTIMVVDDDKAICDTLSLMLSLSFKDYTILTAGDGATAAALFDSMPASAIISDISMPVMDGYQLMAHVRSRSSTVPIIAMSGDCGPDVQESLLSLGVHHHLEKPFQFQHAIQMIESALGMSATAEGTAPAGAAAGVA